MITKYIIESIEIIIKLKTYEGKRSKSSRTTLGRSFGLYGVPWFVYNKKYSIYKLILGF